MSQAPLPPIRGEDVHDPVQPKGLRLSDAESIAADLLDSADDGSLRGALADVVADEDAGPAGPRLADRIEAQLLRRCLDLIGLARRGGGAVSGFEKVRAFLAKSPVGVLLAASDGADDGREKMERLAHGAPIVSALNRQELGQAFGREQVVHAVVASGKIADQLRAGAARWGIETWTMFSGREDDASLEDLGEVAQALRR